MLKAITLEKTGDALLKERRPAIQDEAEHHRKNQRPFGGVSGHLDVIEEKSVATDSEKYRGQNPLAMPTKVTSDSDSTGSGLLT